MSLRSFLRASTCVVLLGAPVFAGEPAVPTPSGERLKTLAAKHHLLIGAATDLNHNDPAEENIIRNEYSILSDENCLKPRATETARGVFDFSLSDRLLGFCRDHGLIGKGHTLLGRDGYLPKWMLDPLLTGPQLHDILVNHITTVVSRYKKGSPRGEIKYWDVLNEVVLNHSVFEKIGLNGDGDPLYIEESFRTARAADPDCTLIWNEDNLELKPAKVEKFLALLKRLKAKGVPIDGVGFQCHLGYDEKALPDFDALAHIVQRFADLGLVIVVSELDVPDRLDSVYAYRKMTQLCIEQPKCVILDTWNVVDKYSWRRAKDKTLLLFDDNYTAKPTYYAVQSALE